VSAANDEAVEVSAKPAISRAATAVRLFFMMSLSMCAGWMPLLIGTYCAATFRNLCDDFAKSVRVLVTLIKAIFGYFSEKRQSRRDRGDFG
jgi:hypothetical protein